MMGGHHPGRAAAAAPGAALDRAQRTPEIFTAASLLLVVATAALMHAVGLSMALGAFLAGVLLAESEYRRELETDLEPFKGLLLGLFFIAVGMSIDFAVVLAQPALVARSWPGFLVVKTAVLVWASWPRHADLPLAERPVFVILLAQGGEFGFVVFQAALGRRDRRAHLVAAGGRGGGVDAADAAAAGGWPTAGCCPPRPARGKPGNGRDRRAAAGAGDHRGFGRYGQIVGRLLSANGIQPTVLDHSATRSRPCAASAGWPSMATPPGWTCCAPPAPTRRACSWWPSTTWSSSVALVDLAREHFPRLQVVARARNVQHWYQLRERGVTGMHPTAA
jgi:glutathione-regulated potassium-efflux system ancillary protein KefC